MAKATTYRYQWTGDYPISFARDWDTQEALVLNKGDWVDVPPRKAEWLDTLDGWKRIPKRKPKPKPAQKKKTAPKAPKKG